jgi:GDP-mannose 6-dehydrogenase
MRISVLGIGHVGTVSAACLARDGHSVIAVDREPGRVADIAAGRSPVLEPGIDTLVGDMVRTGRLIATSDAQSALDSSNLSLVCVGTPGRSDGSLDTSDVVRVSSEIGRAVSRRTDRHTVVVRSTILPGTTMSVLAPAIEAASGKAIGRDIGLAYYPEFMREGSAIADYDNPGSLVFAASDDDTLSTMRSLVAPHSPREVPFATAEAIKYASNAWHGLKVSFANEIGRLCKAAGIDSHDVMETLTADTKLNTSAAYLKPGFAFGGSCLPKDISALRHLAGERGVLVPVLDAILTSNDAHVAAAVDLIATAGNERVCIVGLSYKAGIADLRSSPLVDLAAQLVERGFTVTAYDPNVWRGQVATVRLPGLAAMLMEDVADVARHKGTVVIGNARLAAPLMAALVDAGVAIIDLTRVERLRQTGGAYTGIGW